MTDLGVEAARRPDDGREAPVEVEVDGVAPAAWDRLLGEFEDASYEQAAGWVDARWGRGRSSQLVVRAGGVPVAGARVVLFALPGLRRGVAYVKFGPMWRRRDRAGDARLYAAAVSALVEEYCVRRGHCLTVLPRPAPGRCEEESAMLAALGFTVRRPMEDPHRWCVDLAVDPDERMRRLEQKWRYNLRQALRQGVTCGLAETDDDLRTFAGLHAAMVDRKQVAAEDPLHAIPRLRAELPDALRPRLVLAQHDGRPVAGAVIGVCGDMAFYVFGASDRRALPLRAGYALQWWIVEWLSRRGVRWYDLGGEGGEPGLRQFKKGLVGKAGTAVVLPGEFDRWAGVGGRMAADAVFAARRARRVWRALGTRR